MFKYIIPENILGSRVVLHTYYIIETSVADPDPLVIVTDPWIRIRTKMSQIRNTDRNLGRHFWPKKFELLNMFFL